MVQDFTPTTFKEGGSENELERASWTRRCGEGHHCLEQSLTLLSGTGAVWSRAGKRGDSENKFAHLFNLAPKPLWEALLVDSQPGQDLNLCLE